MWSTDKYCVTRPKGSAFRWVHVLSISILQSALVHPLSSERSCWIKFSSQHSETVFVFELSQQVCTKISVEQEEINNITVFQWSKERMFSFCLLYSLFRSCFPMKMVWERSSWPMHGFINYIFKHNFIAVLYVKAVHVDSGSTAVGLKCQQ